MKKKTILFGIICLMMFAIVTGCGSKKAISTNDFKSKSEKLDYTTVNVLKQYEAYPHVKEATLAQHKDGFQVEFYVIDDDANATSMFNTNKEYFESLKDNLSTELSSNMNNYSTYTLTSNDYYMYLSRVDNTLLFVKVKDSYKEKVKNLIKELGY